MMLRTTTLLRSVRCVWRSNATPTLRSTHSAAPQAGRGPGLVPDTGDSTRGVRAANSNPSTRPLAHVRSTQLATQFAVFWLCAQPAILRLAPRFIAVSRTARPLRTALDTLVRNTFYGQFCAGETDVAVRTTMHSLATRGIGSMLDLAVEADVDDGPGGGSRIDPTIAKKHAEALATQFVASINLAATQSNAWIALKVTALVPPVVLMRASATLDAFRSAFAHEATKNNNVLDVDSLLRVIETIRGLPLAKDTLTRYTTLFRDADRNADGFVSWTDLTDTVLSCSKPDALLSLLAREDGVSAQQPGPNARLVANDIEVLRAVMPHFDALGTKIRSSNVRVLVDAEQTYLQPAIDDIALFLARAVNTPETHQNHCGPLVFNTYQLYKVESPLRIDSDIKCAKRLGFGLGFKIVRGAYMDQERSYAKLHNQSDPICPTPAATHAAYNAAVDRLIDLVFDSATGKPSATIPGIKDPFALCVASHNNASVNRAVLKIQARISELPTEIATDREKVSKVASLVSLATLYGMKDCMATVAAKIPNINCFKYLPYGPVEIVIPYLLRRAVENKDVMANAFALPTVATATAITSTPPPSSTFHENSTTGSTSTSQPVPDLNDLVEVKKELKYRFLSLFS